ncbi:xylose isomerase [Bifidobacterium sp. wkB338]|uniref:sugar phosphate isomerase/epimerase family protein n=1 Tax=Bifidobacterium sp. wkB338 TaxID=2025114 RepID=UPI000EF99510|nr:sugar phosphate isomerase/epimerase family protein [Bifidobacterium sp. wkB338]RMA44270.1 xylose isomerase [Bifidobacterium sp. wkB338]
MMARLSMNVTTTFYGNVYDDIRFAKEAGFDGIEMQSPKLYRFLDQGYTAQDAAEILDGFPVSGLGAIQGITRRSEEDRAEYLKEVERMCQIAQVIGAPAVQMCTDPVDWNVVMDYNAGKLAEDDPRWRGPLGLSEQEAIDVTAHNVQLACDIAKQYGLGIYLEPLCWAPISRCSQLLQIVDKVNRDNFGITVDTWHFWTAGDTLEDVAKIPPEIITAVHVSDGLEIDRGREVPNQDVHRNVVNGGGCIPLQEWIDAIKATGYDGWYCSEMFSDRANEHEMGMVAQTMKNLLTIMIK